MSKASEKKKKWLQRDSRENFEVLQAGEVVTDQNEVNITKFYLKFYIKYVQATIFRDLLEHPNEEPECRESSDHQNFVLT